MSLVLGRAAPPWRVSAWLNTRSEPTLESLRGRVVLVHTFQMLCPGCVQHGLPQISRVQALFDPAKVVVLALHTVFEHHAVMGRAALEAFVHEYRLGFPIGIDQPAVDGPLPMTMHEWGLRGTPSLVLLDRSGVVRLHEFGAVPDLALGAAIASALESPVIAHSDGAGLTGVRDQLATAGCNDDQCRPG